MVEVFRLSAITIGIKLFSKEIKFKTFHLKIILLKKMKKNAKEIFLKVEFFIVSLSATSSLYTIFASTS